VAASTFATFGGASQRAEEVAFGDDAIGWFDHFVEIFADGGSGEEVVVDFGGDGEVVVGAAVAEADFENLAALVIADGEDDGGVDALALHVFGAIG